MAHAALVSLKQLLEEDLIQFPCRVLEFEESKAREFHLRTNEILNNFRTSKCFPSSAVLKEELNGLAPTFHEDLIGKAARSGTVVQDSQMILSRIPDVQRELERFKSSLEVFTHDCGVSGNPSPSSSQEAKFVTDLLSAANNEFEKVITHFSRAAQKAISLHDRVHTWLQKLNDSDYDLIIGIKNSAEKAGDSIENFFAGNNFLLGMKDFTEDKNVFSLLEEIDKSLPKNSEDLPFVGYSQRSRLKIPDSPLVGYSQRSRLQNPRRLMYKYPQWVARFFCAEIDTGSKSPKMSRTESSWKSWIHQKDTVVGLDNSMRKTIDELTGSTSTLKIVTIAGMGGIGKTTLAKSVCSHDRILSHFHCHGLVVDCTSINEVFSQLLDSCDEIQSDQDKGELLRATLRGRRYLIVVDDLRNFEAWNAVKIYLPDDDVGSRILITTRHTEIPNYPPHSLIFMRPLDQSGSWKLLEKLVFGKQNCPPELVHIGKRIAEKCGGLPLAIVALAGTLRTMQSTMPSLCSSWRNVMDNVNLIVSAKMSRTESSWKSWIHQKDTVVGLDNYMRKTIDELTGEYPRRLKIVTIAGMGGIGKTTLAKSVCSHDSIHVHFHCYGLVVGCTSINEVFSQLLDSCDETQSDQDKGELLHAALRRKRYLIVVDGLWNFEAWNAVKKYLPDDNVSSRILITTRHMEIPKIPENPLHSLIFMRPLDERESWKLLEELVSGKQNCPPELFDIGKGIVEKCGGLPLAIVVLARNSTQNPKVV